MNLEPGGERIRIKITSSQYDRSSAAADLLFSEDGVTRVRIPRAALEEKEPENRIELETEGLLCEGDGRITLSYEETELTGMEGSTTAISFDPKEPGLVTMLRDGSVRTVLVFEQHRRHICVYETEYLPLELCIYAYRVENTLTRDGGSLSLDYTIEVRGSASERTKFTLEARKI